MARAVKEEAEAQGAMQREVIKKAVERAKDEGFPTDLEEKEAYFMGQVSTGEHLCAQGAFLSARLLQQRESELDINCLSRR